MKNTLCRITGFLALAFLAITQVARAQDALLVNIPFAFTAGKMTLRPVSIGSRKPQILLRLC